MVRQTEYAGQPENMEYNTNEVGTRKTGNRKLHNAKKEEK